MAGGDLIKEELEVMLSEEIVDVQRRVVPKERVRLETETEIENVPVSEKSARSTSSSRAGTTRAAEHASAAVTGRVFRAVSPAR